MSLTNLSATSLIWTSPVVPSFSSTNAPKLVIPVTFPSSLLPTSIDIKKCSSLEFLKNYSLLYYSEGYETVSIRGVIIRNFEDQFPFFREKVVCSRNIQYIFVII